jgi:hypothetical protein
MVHSVPHSPIDIYTSLTIKTHVQQRPHMFHRGQISLGEANRQKYNRATYHWAILVRPKAIRLESECAAYDVTDTVVMAADETGYHPADGTWRFRSRVPMYPLQSSDFLVGIDVGKLPKKVTNAQVRAVLERTPLPQSGQNPEQNCVSWTREAVVDLQRAGFVDGALGVEALMTVAMQKADGVMRDNCDPGKNEERFINIDIIRREVGAMVKAEQKKGE